MNNFCKIEESVELARKKISMLRKDDSLVFPMFTDLHTVDSDHEFMDRLTFALEYISKKIPCDAVINLGDIFEMLGRNIHITNDELKKRFERVLTAIHEASKVPVINVNGNHDGIGTDFFKQDFWNSIVKGKCGNAMAVYGDEGSYYYIDYEKSNTRLVILSVPCDSDLECDMPTPLWRFGKHQLEWLKNTALDTTKDVIILSHVPFYDKYTGDKEATLGVWDGEKERVSYISALCGGIEDVEDSVAILKEFDGQHNARLVAVLSGHTHEDDVLLPCEEKDGFRNPLPCTQLVTAATCHYSGIERTVGISLDIVVWTPSENKLHMIRIGDGEDRLISI